MGFIATQCLSSVLFCNVYFYLFFSFRSSALHLSSSSNTLNSAFQTCTDTSDAVELFIPQQLYLKPVAKLNVSVQLPQLKLPGKTISNWEVMEKLKLMVKPIQFTVLKVSKSTLEFIRYDASCQSLD